MAPRISFHVNVYVNKTPRLYCAQATLSYISCIYGVSLCSGLLQSELYLYLLKTTGCFLAPGISRYRTDYVSHIGYHYFSSLSQGGISPVGDGKGAELVNCGCLENSIQ